MKPVIKWALAAIVTLVIPVLLWNVLFLEFIDAKGKAVAWICSPFFALASAAIIVKLSAAKVPVIVKGWLTPFWGWAFVAYVIEVFIVLLSNT